MHVKMKRSPHTLALGSRTSQHLQWKPIIFLIAGELRKATVAPIMLAYYDAGKQAKRLQKRVAVLVALVQFRGTTSTMERENHNGWQWWMECTIL